MRCFCLFLDSCCEEEEALLLSGRGVVGEAWLTSLRKFWMYCPGIVVVIAVVHGLFSRCSSLNEIRSDRRWTLLVSRHNCECYPLFKPQAI